MRFMIIVRSASGAEALQWSRRFPSPAGEGHDAVIEVRPLREPGKLPSHPNEDSP
jgi:hypothetical protein